MNPKPFINPYLAGVLLGLVLLLTFYITGRGLGASGAMKSIAVAIVKKTAPEHYRQELFYKEYSKEGHGNPLNEWLVFEVLGILTGAFFSGIVSDRIALRLEKGPRVKKWVRIVAALTGGMLFGFGSQFGRGCTSGSALSGMAVMSLGGLMTMMAIFGSAYALAYFFRKLWLK